MQTGTGILAMQITEVLRIGNPHKTQVHLSDLESWSRIHFLQLNWPRCRTTAAVGKSVTDHWLLNLFQKSRLKDLRS